MEEQHKYELAFPLTDRLTFVTNGMTKRFYAACAAMQGILAFSGRVMGKDDKDCKTVIKLAYEFADELVKQE